MTSHRNASRPELLSPAGDWEALRAAVANGADAVYFGLSAFNARARASNFTLDELPEVMGYLHAHNVRGFVALNILIFTDELPEVVEFVKAIAVAGVDAVIVQDLGLVALIRRLAPTLAIHGSTQMTLTEPRGIAFVQKLGVERVVLARELSLDEIRKVTAGTTVPVEVFIHGALCVAYSGQCLTSEALGGRSANRGQCAQACRMTYEMIVDGHLRDLGDKAYLLSPQDLAAYDLIAPLIEAGVASFKIEGRLKGGPYVAATTSTYRNAIDAALAEQEFHLTRREELDLAQTFSRGLTTGFLDGVNHQKLVRGRVPKSRGILLGKVTGIIGSTVRVELAERVPDMVKSGDGVMFDLGRPEEKEPGGRVWEVVSQGLFAGLKFEPNALDLSRVTVGCEVWKTDDPALRKRLEQTYSQDRLVRRIAVSAMLSGELGGALTLALSDEKHSATASWTGPLAMAQKQATTPETIRAQLGRLGDTPFALAGCEIDVPVTAMVPKSVLNELRRQATAELSAKRTAERVHSIADGEALESMRSSQAVGVSHPRHQSSIHPSSLGGLTPTARRNAELTVLIRNLAQLNAVLPFKPALIYADFEDLRQYPAAVEAARAAGVKIGLATVRIWKPGEDGLQAMVSRAKPDAVLVRNLASIDYFREALPDAELIGDFSLNVANDLTAALLLKAGLKRLVPSFDLNWEQFKALFKHADPLGFEAVVHQHMPMFHNEFCIFAAFLSTGKDHRDCGRPCDRHKVELRDRTGAEFPVLPDTGCRNTVFNSAAQSAAEYVGRMKERGMRWFRVDLLRETPDEVGPLLEQYRRVIAGEDDGRATWKRLKALNQLGVTRGTLNLL